MGWKMAEENNVNHLAIIMDGNGRWAKSKKLSRAAGHKEGVNTIRKILKASKKLKINYLTVYAFSTENWKRPKMEVKALMLLFKDFLKKEVKDLDEDGVRLVFSGSKTGISADLLKEMKKAEEFLKDNKEIVLNIAFNYGGRTEIVEAVNRIIELGEKNIDEETFSKYLYQPEIPDPELLIRTSGEFRISNFLLWQIAYSEIKIVDKYWPDFNEEDLKEALDEFKNRKRRFGGV